MLDKRTCAHIERELELIERLIQDYRELLAIAGEEESTLIERTALGSVLQSFYNGVENIFQTVAKRVDQDMPTGADWHRQLWAQMASTTAVRPALINRETAEQLEPYLGFRHVARHAYSFTLDWTRMQELVQDLVQVWRRFRSDVQAFLKQPKLSEDVGS